MKNKIVKMLLSTLIAYSIMPFPYTYAQNINTADVIKEHNDTSDNTITNNNISYYKVYTTANVNIRSQPNTKSKILDTLNFNTQIKICNYNHDWAIIQIKNTDYDFAYINKKYVSKKCCKYTKFYLPSNNGFKSYMPYTSITNAESLQYNLQQNYAYTGKFGIRQVNGRYCIAIGTAFNASIGTYCDLILENNTVIPCIVSDIKSSKDTLSDNITTKQNGCISEFIVDKQVLHQTARKMGDISFCSNSWDSPVKMIRIYDKNIFK